MSRVEEKVFVVVHIVWKVAKESQMVLLSRAAGVLLLTVQVPHVAPRRKLIVQACFCRTLTEELLNSKCQPERFIGGHTILLLL